MGLLGAVLADQVEVMDLRDCFAAHVIANTQLWERSLDPAKDKQDFDRAARIAYEVADALLKARNREPSP